MLMTFRSDVWNSIIMDRDTGVRLLKLAGHSGTVPGALLAADISSAMTRLNAGLDREDPRPARGAAAKLPDDPDEPQPVGLRLRAFALQQMLKAAAQKNADVTWEEGAAVV